MIIWIVNPYGSLPDESWRTYRSTMIASALMQSGHQVVQFISNFEHRSKTFRGNSYEIKNYGPLYDIHVIPGLSYKSHISLDRIRYERRFGHNFLKYAKTLQKPDCIVLAEPSICYYDIIFNWLKKGLKTKIIIDLIDIWPELFHLLIPRSLDGLARMVFSPLYFWRRRLYKNADGLVAVSKNYQEIALKIHAFRAPLTDVVYWSIPEKEIHAEFDLSDEKIKQMISLKKAEEVWCVYAGTLGENYDIYSIIEAGKRLKERYAPERFKLLIAGDGPLKDYCNDNSNDSGVTFLGRLDSGNLAELFKKCDFALSTYKGRSTVAMPIKAFDYLAFGLPLVNSLKRDLGYFVETKSVGINYVAESVDSLFDAICNLVEDTDKRIRMKQNALSLSSEFSEQKQYAKFVKVIENAVNGK